MTGPMHPSPTFNFSFNKLYKSLFLNDRYLLYYDSINALLCVWRQWLIPLYLSICLNLAKVSGNVNFDLAIFKCGHFYQKSQA